MVCEGHQAGARGMQCCSGTIWSNIVAGRELREGLAGTPIARPQRLPAEVPATGTVVLSARRKRGKPTCKGFLNHAFERSLLRVRYALLFQKSKKGPPFVRYDPLSGFPRNQPLSENIEIRRLRRQSLRTIRPLRTAGVEHRQVILEDGKARPALRLAGENPKYRDLKTHFLQPNAVAPKPQILAAPAGPRAPL
jgi:hypothetical protein